jgi:hypothetical protein
MSFNSMQQVLSESELSKKTMSSALSYFDCDRKYYAYLLQIISSIPKSDDVINIYRDRVSSFYCLIILILMIIFHNSTRMGTLYFT